MGMHSADPEERRACVSLFAARLAQPLGMSLEQVGACDDLIWRYGRVEQDAHYPFMDNLHSALPFQRIAYTEDEARVALADGRTQLTLAERMCLAQVGNADAVLWTLNPRLLATAQAGVRHPADASDSGHGHADASAAELAAAWPGSLANLYVDSLALSVPAQRVAA